MANATEILLYGLIGTQFDGIDPLDFHAQLKSIAGPVTVRINSPGGDAADGIAIYSQLRARPDAVTIHIDSEAGSVASLVAMAGDRRIMASGAWMMVHEPLASVIGNPAVLRKRAFTLDLISGQVAAIYAARSDTDDATVRQWMADETWFDAGGAVAAGLATGIAPDLAIAACSAGPMELRHQPAGLVRRADAHRYRRALDRQRAALPTRKTNK